MIEKIRKISNPLTIIAIFAGLAEISGTVVLPFLEGDSQALYLWFLMLFPVLLVVLFFITLNFNYKVLYAPSDFQDEDNFLKLFGKPTFVEKAEKISSELSSGDESGAQINDLKYRDLIRNNLTTTHYMAEELVMSKLEGEFDQLDRDVMFRPGRYQFLFDGIASKHGHIYAIEVKYLKDESSMKNLRSSLNKIRKALSELSESERRGVTVLIALATDLENGELDRVTEQVADTCSEQAFDCDFRIYNLAKLEKEVLKVSGL